MREENPRREEDRKEASQTGTPSTFPPTPSLPSSRTPGSLLKEMVDYKKLKVPELKEALAKRGLPTDGVKARRVDQILNLREGD